MAATIMNVTINGGISVSDGLPLAGSYSFSEFIGFGDSNTDTGYFFTHPISSTPAIEALYQQALAAGGGLPTDPGSPMNTTLIANALGLSATAYGEPGGTNYAASGATITGNQVNALAPSVVQQIEIYLSSNHGVADPNAIYYISGGGNSVTAAQAASSSLSTQQAYMVSEANAMASELEKLWNSGARNIVLDDNAGNTSLATTYNGTLWADLDAAGISYVVADDRNLIKNITKSPNSFGIANVVNPPGGPFTAQNPYDPANGGSAVDPSPAAIADGWSRFATHDVSSTAATNYLWADDEHLSGAGQQIEATYTLNTIENGQPHVSQILLATQQIVGEGTVSSSEVTFQWQREVDGSSTWTDISGATSRTYIVTSADVGDHLRVEGSFNRAGADSASAVSPATLAVSSAITAPAPALANQVFIDTAGSDVVHGGSGLDTVVYNGKIASFGVTVGSAVSAAVTGTGTDHLGSIERLQFTDGVIALDAQGNAGNAYRLYQAAFDRTPDTAGLSFWTHQLDLGLNIQTVAQDFTNSTEFKTLYGGSNPSATTLIDLLYNNVLGRAPDQAGFNFWAAQLAAGTSVGAVLEGFAVSSENHGIVDPKIAQGIVLDHTAFLV